MYTLLIPRQSSLREKKSGGGSPFWKSFWEKKVAENPTYYKQQYEERQSRLKRSAASFNSLYGDRNKKYYIEVKLDPMADSKTNEPDIIWKESGVQVVETKDDGIFTISGTGDDIKKLGTIINNASFINASKLNTAAKKNSLAREVYSVTALFDKNTSVEKRISKDIKAFIESSGDTISQDCILVVYYDQPKSEYDNLFNILSQTVGGEKIEKIDTRFFISNMSFRGNLTKVDINNILNNERCNFIRWIKPLAVFGATRTTPNNNSTSLNIGNLLTNETAVVIDSGIDHPEINRFVIQHEKLLSTGQIEDKNHGTEVTSRLLFGENMFTKVENNEQIDPVGKIIDIQVIHKEAGGNSKADEKALLDAIDKSVRKYSDQALVYNLSIANRNQVDEVDIDEITELIDYLSNKKDVLFVCASGNQTCDFNLGYEDIFNSPNIECHIASPADAINALTVGSITGFSDCNSICELEKFPSPFTRKGGHRNDIKKPELVAIGGNIKKDSSGGYSQSHLESSKNTYGVPLINCNGFARDVGSSYSAPLIARDCLLLLDYLKKSNITTQLGGFTYNKANLVKALMIHSTTRVPQSNIKNDGLKRAYGFGQPNMSGVLKDNENQISVIYADKISYKEKKQKILIHLPASLKDKKIEFSFTMVYNPPINKNFKEYKMIDLQPAIGFISPEIKNGVPTGKNKFDSIQPPHSWENYRSKYFNTIHFIKKRKLTKLDFQILVQMLISNRFLDENIGHEDNISQNYALVLTMKDLSESGTLRSEMLNSNQFHELIENTVQIQTRN